MKRLQSIQYSLCRIIFRKSRYSKDHMSPYLKALHWLPLQQRIKFKQFCLIYKIVNHGRPSYFSPFFVKHSSGQFTRRSSAESVFLNRDIVPFNRSIHRSKTQFDHCFFTYVPVRWNNLPTNIRSALTLCSFRSRLKTFLFNQAFPT